MHSILAVDDSASMRALALFLRAGWSGPRLEPDDAAALYGVGDVADACEDLVHAVPAEVEARAVRVERTGRPGIQRSLKEAYEDGDRAMHEFERKIAGSADEVRKIAAAPMSDMGFRAMAERALPLIDRLRTFRDTGEVG